MQPNLNLNLKKKFVKQQNKVKVMKRVYELRKVYRNLF